LFDRYIDRDRKIGVPERLGPLDEFGCGAEYENADLVDLTGFFGYRNEFSGIDETLAGIVPAGEGFKAGDSARFQV
jgi:hypothetical protein